MEDTPTDVRHEMKTEETRISLFIIIMVLFMITGAALNWILLYLIKFKKDNTNYEQSMQMALATSIINLIFLVILVFGLFIVWRYRRWNYVSYMDRVTYIVWLLLTVITFITTVINFWTFGKLNGTITAADLDNAREGALWGASIFTSGVFITICVYAIRGYRAQLDNGLFYRSFRAMREARIENAYQKYNN